MSSCEVCCEKHNRKQNTPVNCPACELTCCRKCSETYLLSIFEEPHCMGCKAQWDRQFIDSWCTQVFRNNAYRKHREEVLFEKENHGRDRESARGGVPVVEAPRHHSHDTPTPPVDVVRGGQVPGRPGRGREAREFVPTDGRITR